MASSFTVGCSSEGMPWGWHVHLTYESFSVETTKQKYPQTNELWKNYNISPLRPAPTKVSQIKLVSEMIQQKRN